MIKRYTKQERDELVLKYLENESKCISSTIFEFGNIIGPGHLIVAGATTGSGKSHIALAEALSVIRRSGASVLYIHNEMTDAQLIQIAAQYGYTDDEFDNNILFDETNEYFNIKQDIDEAVKLGVTIIIIDHLDIANLTDNSGRQGYEVLQRFLGMIDNIRKNNTELCFYIFSQLNGRFNRNKPIDMIVSELDFANCHSLPNKADFSYVFCKNENEVMDDSCAIQFQVRKDRYNVAIQRDFARQFNYKTGQFRR